MLNVGSAMKLGDSYFPVAATADDASITVINFFNRLFAYRIPKNLWQLCDNIV